MQAREMHAGEDRARIEALIQEITAFDGTAPFGESKIADFGGPFLGRGFIAESKNEVIGYAHSLFYPANGVTEIELAVDPAHRDGPTSSILLEAVRAAVSPPVLWWTHGDASATVAHREGAILYRQLQLMRGPLPPDEIPTIPEFAAIRAFRPTIDDHAWLQVNNEAFADHPENGNWTVQDLRSRLARPWFDPEGFRVAWADDRIAGFCWTKRHDLATGEIYVIAVHPDYRGRGLGRAIVLEGMHHLAGRGCHWGMLYVDAADESALGLYVSLGFSVERVDRCFSLPNV